MQFIVYVGQKLSTYYFLISFYSTIHYDGIDQNYASLTEMVVNNWVTLSKMTVESFVLHLTSKD